MKKVNMKYTSVSYKEDGVRYKMKVSYGFHCFEGQEPYFSITAEVKGSDGYNACGCLHDEILQHAPELAPLIKWHLVSLVKGPMHYIANGIFWWEQSLKEVPEPAYKGDTTAIDEKAIDSFKSTVVYGTTSFDKIDFKNRELISPKAIRVWMNTRFNELMQSFYKDLKMFQLIEVKK